MLPKVLTQSFDADQFVVTLRKHVHQLAI